MIKIKNISKSFGNKIVFENFSHEFYRGSKTLISGQSGAGKTTLLRLIAGLEDYDKGSICISDNASMSFMFQEPRLFPWMNVYDNISSVISKSDAYKIPLILDELEIGNEIHTFPYELSGGMQRRVSLARALLYPAQIFLFDEPFAGLDFETATIASDVIFKYTQNKTVIIVSHDKSMLPMEIYTLNI